MDTTKNDPIRKFLEMAVGGDGGEQMRANNHYNDAMNIISAFKTLKEQGAIKVLRYRQHTYKVILSEEAFWVNRSEKKKMKFVFNLAVYLSAVNDVKHVKILKRLKVESLETGGLLFGDGQVR